MCIDNAQIDKQMLVEGICYYCAAAFWIRVVALKRSNNIALTDNKVRLMSIFEGTTLNIPEPLYLYLRGFGTIEDQGTGQNLIAVFPNLPETPVNGFGGYWDAINADNHNDYEEYPAVGGVVAEGLRQAISNAGTGAYASSIVPEGLVANTNLNGFRSLGNRRNEAKNFFLNLGLGPAAFPESIQETSINYGLVQALSTWIDMSATFKNSAVDLTKGEKTGSNSQLVNVVPQARDNAAGIPCRSGVVHARSRTVQR